MEFRAYDDLPLYVGLVAWHPAPNAAVVTDPHRHPHPELCIGWGRATLALDFGELTFDGASAIVVPPGVVHRWTIHEPFELAVVGLQPGSIDMAVTGTRWAGQIDVPEAEADDLKAMLRIARRRFEESPHDPQVSGATVAAVLELLTDWPGERVERNTLVDAFLGSIESRPDVGSVVEHARLIGCSRAHLTAVVTEALGRSPKDVIASRRVLEAKRRLALTADSAASIGRVLGFADASQFGRWFRSNVGETPGAFRDRPVDVVDRAGPDEPT